MNDDIRARLLSLAVQSEEAAKKYQEWAAEAREREMYVAESLFWEGMAEKAEKRAARCREKLEQADEWPFKTIKVVVVGGCAVND